MLRFSYGTNKDKPFAKHYKTTAQLEAQGFMVNTFELKK